MSFVFKKIQSCAQSSQNSQPSRLKSQIFKNNQNQIQSAKKNSFIESKYMVDKILLKIFKGLLTLVNIFSVVCGFFFNVIEQQNDMLLVYFYFSFFSICSAVFSILACLTQAKLKLNQQKEQQISSVANTITIIFYLIHPSYFLDEKILSISNQLYSINQVLVAFTHFRIISILVYLVQISRFYGLRSERILELFGKDKKSLFGYSLRSIFKYGGILSPFFILLLWISFLPFIEFTLQQTQGQKRGYFTILYYEVITMTTVGYGQVVKEDFMYRLFVITIILMGSFSSSVLTLVVIMYFKFDQRQRKAYVVLKRLEINSTIQQEKKRIVRHFIHAKRKNSSKVNNFNHQFKHIIGNKIKQGKSSLNQYDNLQSFHQFYFKKFMVVETQMKKIVQKQLLANQLINFYVQRRSRQDEMTKSIKSSSSQKTNKSRKGRVVDNNNVGKIKKQIFEDM